VDRFADAVLLLLLLLLLAAVVPESLLSLVSKEGARGEG
jgi:hypothetical protein